MVYAALPDIQKNSISTLTTSDMTEGSLSVEVDEQAVFYKGGVLLTAGIEFGPDNAVEFRTEECVITSTDGTSGPGTVNIATRAVGADGTNGAAYAWPAGTRIRSSFSSAIYASICGNFNSLRTAATTSIYVDKAATGTGNGTSWTNAFTTIQAAINSLPTVLENDVTIYIRKGTTAYSETLTIQQITGKGSLNIRGEYYWNGQCATASDGASTTKFNTDAHADGANIAVGDRVLVTSGYGGAGEHNYYVLSTVKAVTDEGSNIYRIELNDALDSGNLGTGCYYTIVKTELASAITVTNTALIRLYGIYDSVATPLTLNRSSVSEMSCLILIGSSFCVTSILSLINNIRNSYIATSSTNRSALAISNGSGCSIGVSASIAQSAAYTCVLYSATTNNSYAAIQISTGATCSCYGAILKGVSTTGTGILALRLGFCEVANTCIVYNTGTGLRSTYNGAIQVGIGNNNNATTPKTPASATDAAYIT
jgi:hypothetical protein